MPLIINTNSMSLNAQRHLSNNTGSLSKTMERLASGYRINRAGDDAAGLQLSENLRAQIRGSQKALDNTLDGVNFLNLADGSLQTIQDNLQRIRELTVQAANDTYATAQRTAITQEIDQLRADIDRISNAAQFNGVLMLASTGLPANFWIQVGANSSGTNDRIDIAPALGDSTAITGLGLTTAGGNVSNNSAAQAYLTLIDTAIRTVNVRRGNLGAIINRLNGAVSNLQISIENQSSSESRIRNADIASESAELTRNQILQQSAATILSQANQSPQLALTLLKGGG